MSTEPLLFPPRHDLQDYCADLGHRARSAERLLRIATGAQKNDWLLRSATALESHTGEVLQANARDLAAAEALGLSTALLDRLKLTTARLRGMADGLRAVADLPDPIGRILDSSMRPN